MTAAEKQMIRKQAETEPSIRGVLERILPEAFDWIEITNHVTFAPCKNHGDHPSVWWNKESICNLYPSSIPHNNEFKHRVFLCKTIARWRVKIRVDTLEGVPLVDIFAPYPPDCLSPFFRNKKLRFFCNRKYLQ